MFYQYKWCHGLLNGLALLLKAASVIVGAVRENSFVVVGLTAFGTVIKEWNELKKFSFKVDMCRFAYTTYEKTLIELKTYVRGLPLEEFDTFLVKLQTLDDTITNVIPPVSDRCEADYCKLYRHTPVESPRREHKNTTTAV